MKIILLTIVAGLILLWGGIGVILKWITPIERRHVLWLGAYLSVVCGVVIGLVISTYSDQQSAAYRQMAGQAEQQLEAFRKRLGEITEKLMSQIEEKAQLTESEMEVRGDLQSERAEHALARKSLAQTQHELAALNQSYEQERAVRTAYVDSLNTERALHADAAGRLRVSEQALQETRVRLGATEQQAATLGNDVKRLRGVVESAEERVRRAEENEKGLLQRLEAQATQLGAQKEALGVLQAAVDSIYLKTVKRPRGAAPGPSD